MKAIITLSTVLSFLIFSCAVEPVDQYIEADRLSNNESSEVIATTDLIAGQNEVAGSIIVSLDGDSLSVLFQTEGDWLLLDTHLYVGPESELPMNGGGNPRIGHFPYGETFPNGSTEANFEAIATLLPGECIIIAAHAVVVNTVTGQEETAWGSGQPYSNGNGNGNGNGGSWAMKFEVCNVNVF